MQRLVQEMQVHLIELKMQNEELRHTQLQLLESRDRYVDLYDFAPIAYLTLDKYGNISAANHTAASKLGISKVALLKANITYFIDSASRDTLYFHLQQVYAEDSNNQKQHCELTITKPNGKNITVHVQSVRNDGKDTTPCRTILVDITQQKKQADALQASEQRYHRISNAVSDFIYHMSFADGRRGKVILDTTSEDVTGYSADELIAMDNSTKVIVHPEDWPQAEDQFNKLVADADTTTAELRIITKGGDIRWVSNTLSALRDKHGKLIGYDGALHDITDRKVAQLALQTINTELADTLDSRNLQLDETVKTVKLMATAMANLLEGVVIMQHCENSDDYCVVYANKAMATMSGYTADTLIGKTLAELKAEAIVPDNITVFKHAITELGRYPQAGSLRLPTGHEGYRDVEILTSPIFDLHNQISHLVLIYRDVTVRKEAELELYKRDEHLKAILSTVADVIFTIDTQGDIRNVNPVAHSLFGYSTRELEGRNIMSLFPSIATGGSGINPIAIFINKNTNRYNNPIDNYREYPAQRKDGSSVLVSLSIREIDHSGLFTCVIRDLSLIKSMQRQMLNIAEEENQRIGRELHDSIQQQLVGTRLLADNLLSDTQGLSQQTVVVHARLTQALDHAIDDLRKLCRGMALMNLDGDSLRAALHQLGTGVAEGRNIHCNFNSSGQIILNDNAVSGHIYRIAQEAVANAIKHAQATQITISLRAEKGQLILKVCDDGIGIRDEDLKEDSMGLQIMQYRAGLAGGNLKIYSPTTGGTCLLCSVPAPTYPSKRLQTNNL